MQRCIHIMGIALLFAGAVYGQYQKVQSNGMDVYYRVFGEGKPVLIIGGGPGDVSDRYLSLCEGLAKDFRCILVEQRGTGKSMPAVCDSTTISLDLTIADFEAIRASLGLKAWVVLGFSYGGYVASLYAIKHPAAVASLVLLESMGLNTAHEAYFLDNINCRLWAEDKEKVKYWRDSLKVPERFHHAIVEIIRARMPGYFFSREKGLAMGREIKDTDFNFEMGEWIGGEMMRPDMDLSKRTPAFAGRVLIIHGRQDPLGESVPHALARYYPNAALVFVERAGHYAWVEQPEKVFGAIREFLAGKK